MEPWKILRWILTSMNITQYCYKATHIYRLFCALFSDQPSDGWESEPDAGKSPPMVAETQAHRDHPHTNLQSRFAFVKPLVFKIVFLSPVCRNGKMKVFASSIEQGQSEIQEFTYFGLNWIHFDIHLSLTWDTTSTTRRMRIISACISACPACFWCILRCS